MTQETAHYEQTLGTMETVITGRNHYETPLVPGEETKFLREPWNEHDRNAIRALNVLGVQVGYLPRRIAKWMAPLVDREMVKLRGIVTRNRRLRHGLTPLDLEVRLTQAGEGILMRRANPASGAEAWHEVVLNTWNMAERWSNPEAITELDTWLRTASHPDALPETQLLLALFPTRIRRAQERLHGHSMERLREALGNVVIGDAQHHHNLTLFPLYTPNGHEPKYRLLEEAIAAGEADVREISEGGSVPELLVENRGGMPLFIPEGEVLTGAKQNRVVNISVMVAAHSKLVLPVSCVEQGRWRHTSRSFATTHYAPPSMRGKKSRSVNMGRMADGGVRSNQGEVWRDVSEALYCSEVESTTDSLTEGMDKTRERRGDYRDALRLPEAASGVLLATEGRVIGMDLFDSSQTLRKLWPRLSDAYYFQASMARAETRPTEAAEAEAFLEELPLHTRPAARTIGAGTEFVIQGPDTSGNALWHDDHLCHLAACGVG